MPIYKGFSTQKWLEQWDGEKLLQETDINLVKTDIKNHIFTRIGERIMQPGFGTRIPDLTFEPNDLDTVKIVRDDILMVLEYEPRVKLISLDVLPVTDNNAIIAIAVVKYLEFDVVDELRIDVKSR
jgi:phage baseplate assembly protein W